MLSMTTGTKFIAISYESNFDSLGLMRCYQLTVIDMLQSSIKKTDEPGDLRVVP